MTTKQTFWGSFFITIGGLFLLNNAFQFDFAWHFLWKLWPLILIIWGVSVLTTNTIVRHILSVVKALLLAVVIFSAVRGSWHSWEDENWDDDVKYEEKTFTTPLNNDSKTASLILKAGAGKFTIRDTTEDLFYAKAHSSVNDFQFDTDSDKNEVALTMQEKKFHFRSITPKNFADISLNSNPVWNMNIDFGAASGDFDLSKYKISDVKINTGAASLNLRLGDLQNEANVSVKTGVSSVNIAVPSSVGCEINSKTGLASKNYSGFREINSHKYSTDNFDSASKKIYLSIDAGISSINVSRY